MVVCRFFQQGTCKFGNNCRFQHIARADSETNYAGSSYNSRNNQPSYGFSTSNRFGAISGSQPNKYAPKPFVTPTKSSSFTEFVTIVCNDVDAALKGKQWALSCYGPGGQNAGTYPGLEDTSPEELRWEAYQCRQRGSLQTYIQGFEQLINKHEAINLEIMSRSPKVVDTLGQFFSPQSQSGTPNNQTPSFGNASGSTGASPSNFSFSLSHLNSNPPNQPPAFSGANTSQPFGQAANQFTTSNTWTNAQPFGSSNQQVGFSQAQNMPSFGSSAPNSSFTNPAYEPPKPASSIFGGSATPAAVPFSVNPVGSSAFNQQEEVQVAKDTEKQTSSTYTPMDQLTKEEQEQFIATTFTFGRIPIRPPPKELCFNMASYKL